MKSTDEMCELCNCNSFSLLFTPTKSPGPVVRCVNCGFVFISPRQNSTSIIHPHTKFYEPDDPIQFSSNLDDIKNSWELRDIQFKENQFETHKINFARSLQRISKHHQPGKLLDFGCGGGFFLRIARENGWEVYGLEPLPAHAVYTRATSGASVINNVLDDDTYPKNFFDVITSYQVFEHLPDPMVEMMRLTQFLKPSGLLLIEVPNIDTWSVRLFGLNHRHFVIDHLYFYSKSTLTLMMKRCGLNLVSVTYPNRIMSMSHVGNWMNRLFPKTRGITKILKGKCLSGMKVSVNVHDIIEIIGQKSHYS